LVSEAANLLILTALCSPFYFFFMQNQKQSSRKRVILSVSNDLEADQRLHKVASSLLNLGFKPLLVGFGKSEKIKKESRDYDTKLLAKIFKKGPLFYVEFNTRLFFYLLFSKTDIMVANDLDSLLANYLAYRIKRIFNKKIHLVYDSHELYTELPELNGRPVTRKIWLAIEKWIMPKIKNAYTVCQPIADYYFEKYKIKMQVIRNMPLCTNAESDAKITVPQISTDKKIILYQGALNIGRGIEQVIDIMPFIDNAVFIVAGTGTIAKDLRQRVIEKNLTEKVYFPGKLPFTQLNQLTKIADLGLVLQDDISLSYRYVLPNRLFDFIKAGVPVIASDLPEISKIVNEEGIGLLVNGLNDPELLTKINRMLNDEQLRKSIEESLTRCSSKYCWENEEQILKNIYLTL